MVLSQGLYEKFERERQKLREEGRQEGFQQGRKQVQQEWETWNRLRLEAKERGEPFDVPPPTKDKHGHDTEAGLPGKCRS